MIKTKSDFGPDEFKVIREIILAHPRLQKKRKIGQMACVIAAFLMVLFALGTFLDRFILDCFIEYTLIFLAFAIFFIWFAKVGIYLEQDLVFKVIQNKTFDNVKNGTIEYIFDSDGVTTIFEPEYVTSKYKWDAFQWWCVFKNYIYLQTSTKKNSIGEKKQFNSRRLCELNFTFEHSCSAKRNMPLILDIERFY